MHKSSQMDGYFLLKKDERTTTQDAECIEVNPKCRQNLTRQKVSETSTKLELGRNMGDKPIKRSRIQVSTIRRNPC